MVKRPYLQLDLAYFEDDRVLELSPLAQLLHIRCMTVAKKHGTDGRVTERQIKYVCQDLKSAKALVNELLAVELLDRRDECAFEIRSWLDWNKSSAEMATVRADRAKAGRDGGIESGKTRRLRAV